jgi:glycerol-3-phosphate acyltransferase PlsY
MEPRIETVTAALMKIVLAYLLGAVSGSLMVGRLRGVDIRELGSGNAGGTNAFRTQGLWFALGVVVIDVGKGVLAAGVVPGLALPPAADSMADQQLTLACGLAAVVGHCYPVWHGFRGGKGAATAVGVLLAVNPWLLVPRLVTWLLVLGLSGYVSIATVLAGFSLVPAVIWMDAGPNLPLFAVLLALFMAFMHRGNFRALATGEEYRFERARIANWFARGDR